MTVDDLQTRRRLRKLMPQDVPAKIAGTYHPRLRGNLTIMTKKEEVPLTFTVTRGTRGVSGTISSHSMLTRGTATSLSRNAVFNTSELLEKIFMHLSKVSDVLTVRGVNKQWKAVLDSSPHIQRKLFRKSSIGNQRCAFDKGYKILRPDAGDIQAIAAYVRPGSLNSHLLKREHVKYRASLHARAKIAETLTLQHRPKIALALNKKTIYGQMFLTQPPAIEVACEIVFHSRRGARPGWRRVQPKQRLVGFRVRKTDGVTNRDVWEKFADTVKKLLKDPIQNPEECVIDKDASKVWVMGVMFPSEDEVKEVVGSGPKA